MRAATGRQIFFDRVAEGLLAFFYPEAPRRLALTSVSEDPAVPKGDLLSLARALCRDPFSGSRKYSDNSYGDTGFATDGYSSHPRWRGGKEFIRMCDLVERNNLPARHYRHCTLPRQLLAIFQRCCTIPVSSRILSPMLCPIIASPFCTGSAMLIDLGSHFSSGRASSHFGCRSYALCIYSGSNRRSTGNVTHRLPGPFGQRWRGRNGATPATRADQCDAAGRYVEGSNSRIPGFTAILRFRDPLAARRGR